MEDQDQNCDGCPQCLPLLEGHDQSYNPNGIHILGNKLAHENSEFCWCDPTIEETDEDVLIIHATINH